MIVFLLLSLSIYWVSKLIVKEVVIFLRKFFSSNTPIYIILSLIYLPGTIVHEAAHFITALLLILPVKSMTVFPSFYEGEIKLGEVRFEKRDVFRGIIVGIAPFFFGLATLSAFFVFHLFPNVNFWLNIVFGYLIFSISSNMFSSKQDLEGLIFLIPLMALILAIFYIFDIKLNLFLFNQILDKIDYYLFFVLCINIVFSLIFKVINYKTR